MACSLRGIFTAIAAVLIFAGTSQAGLSAEAKCESGKNQVAGKYAACLQKAEAKLRKTKGACSVTTQLACYLDAECPVSETCPKDTTKYDDAVAKCSTKYTVAWGKLEQKALDNATTCPTEGDQTIVQGTVDECSGTVATLLDVGRFVDNGDGTVTDNWTRLIWEKKTTAVGSGSNYADPHDVDNYYSWTVGPSGSTTPNGTVFTDFLDKLNGQGGAGTGFAGFYDWRLPSKEELLGIVDTSAGPPQIYPIFGATLSAFYWSVTTDDSDPGRVWYVAFNTGTAGVGSKQNLTFVRAVRGGF